MKKRINLFKSREGQQRKIQFIEKIRLLCAIAAFILVVIFLYFSYLNIQIRKSIQTVNLQKQTYLNFLVENKNIEAKLRYFKNKQTQLTAFLGEDARFLPYYKLLKDVITSSSESASIESIVIDKTRNTDFIVRFVTYDSMIRFFNYIESDEFLKHFSKLSLTQFNIVEDEAKLQKKNYALTFTGIFKQVQYGY